MRNLHWRISLLSDKSYLMRIVARIAPLLFFFSYFFYITASAFALPIQVLNYDLQVLMTKYEAEDAVLTGVNIAKSVSGLHGWRKF